MLGASGKLPDSERSRQKMTKRSESVTRREIAGFMPVAEIGTVLGLQEFS